MSLPERLRSPQGLKSATRGFVPDVPAMPRHLQRVCWLVQRGLVASSSVSKQSEEAMRTLWKTLRALSVILAFENALRGLNSQQVRANSADISRQPDRAEKNPSRRQYTIGVYWARQDSCQEVTYRVYYFVTTSQGYPDILSGDLDKHVSWLSYHVIIESHGIH